MHKQKRQNREHAVVAKAISPGAMDRLCALLKVMSNPKRLKILMHLLQGESSVGEIETALGIKQPNLSHELRKLRDQNLVITRRQSKVVFYAIANDGDRKTIRHILAILSGEQVKNQSLSANSDCGQFATIT